MYKNTAECANDLVSINNQQGRFILFDIKDVIFNTTDV